MLFNATRMMDFFFFIWIYMTGNWKEMPAQGSTKKRGGMGGFDLMEAGHRSCTYTTRRGYIIRMGSWEWVFD